MMRVFTKIFAVLFAASAPALSSAAEIITAPGDYVFVNAANAGKGYYDVMVQTVIIHNDGDTPVTLTGLQIDAIGGGASILTKNVPIIQVTGASQGFLGMAAQGFDVFLNAQLLNEDGLSAVLGDEATLSPDASLTAGEALIISSQYFATDSAPETVIITASFTNADGKIVTAHRQLEVRRRDQAIDYRAPLSGDWLMRAFPNIASHHRYIPSNEFAMDFFKTGDEGALDKGQKLSAEDDFGYGEPVLAVADGEVIFVIEDQVQSPDALTRRDGESVDEARSRITQYQMQRYASDFRAAAAGNMITIRHEGGGRTEYSSYAHLKSGSIAVKVGDTVQQGDVIAAVGNTGDSTLTHLHFQINAGPDAFFSRSLPVTFSNGEPQYLGQDPGLYMEFGD